MCEILTPIGSGFRAHKNYVQLRIACLHVLRAGLAINVSGVIRISLKNEHEPLKSDQNFLWAVFNGEQEKVVLVFSL